MPTRPIFLVILVLSSACAGVSQRPRVAALDGVVMPASMCARRGEQAASKDAPGSQMFCEIEELVGSHMPRCICRDEQQIARERDDAQQMRRDAEAKQPLRGD